MKKITVYALEGCDQCKLLIDSLDGKLGEEITLSKKFCAADDSACDALEEGVGTSRYPMVLMSGFNYATIIANSEEFLNKSNLILYISNRFRESGYINHFNSDTLTLGVSDLNSIVEKIKQVIN